MNRFDKFYMMTAENAAKLSYAKRMQVGAVAVKNNDVLAFSYNGTLPGQSNVCEDLIDGKLVTKDDVIHAEENVILKISRKNESSVGATLYCTLAPCKKCARMIAGAGFTRLVYKDIYRDPSGIELLKDVGVLVEQFERSEDE